MDDQKKIFEFIKEHRLAVLSTVNTEALPEASVVAFAAKLVKDVFEIHIATFDSSRKVLNLKRNPRVALVIGWEHGKTVQIEGEALEVSGAEEIQEIKQSDFEHMPSLAKYIHPERAVFYKIIPRWLRYSDFSIEPWERVELKFI